MSERTRTAVAQRRQAVEKVDDDRTPAATTTIAQAIKAQQKAIARALPQNIDPERFTRIALTEIRRNPKLGECTQLSLLGGIMLCAQLGLEPGPLGHAYLVPYWNRNTRTFEAQFQLGYKGIIDLARRSGQIVSIVAREVCVGDHFEFEYGLDEKLVHRPELGDRGDAFAYYGVAKFRDGGHFVLVMSRADVDKYRLRAQSQKAGEPPSGPWATDYDAMARKTVIRRMAPFLPVAVEMARAVASDEAIVRFDADDADDLTTVHIDPEGAIDAESEEVTPDSPPAAGAGAGDQEKTETPATGDAPAEPAQQTIDDAKPAE